MLGTGWSWTQGGPPDDRGPLPTGCVLDLDPDQGLRSPEVLVRPYVTGRPDPAAFAELLSQEPQVGRRVQCLNEINLPLEGWVATPADYAAWFEQVADRAPPGARLYWMPPSPGVSGWQDYYTDPACEEAIRRADGLSVHAYGTATQMLDVVDFVLALWPDKPVWVSECNFGAGQAVDLDAWARTELVTFLDACAGRPRVEAVNFFSFWWDQSASLPTSVNGVGTAVEDVLHAWVPPVVGGGDVLEGCDISNHQGSCDLAAMEASGRSFVMIKACEDAAYVDRYFAGPDGQNWRNAREAGLARGAYSFARPSASSPAESVTLLESRIAAGGGLQRGDMVVLDIEDDHVAAHADLLTWVAEWCALAEEVFGVPPVIYSGTWYLEPHGLCDPVLGKYPLWLASYQESVPPCPGGWEKISFWQYTDRGSVPGVSGGCDCNRFFGTEAELGAIGYRGEPVPPTPVPAGIEAVRDQVWALAGQADALGHPWYARALQSATTLSKGEQ